jgi:molybdopterin-synthase adenylyltransferase
VPIKLKDVYWARQGEELFLYTPAAEEITLADPSHQVQRLLIAMREGTESLADLAVTLSLPVGEVADAVAALDDLGLVTAAEAGSMTALQRERYRSNLALFEACGSLGRAAAAFQEALLEAHVVCLGAGGVGTAVLQALCAAGVGRFTLLDFDRVERKNLSRQFLYREGDIGRLKVDCAAEWVRGYNPDAAVTTVNARIGSPDDVSAVLAGADLVIGAVDQPFQVQDWVDEACVCAGVRYVFGGGRPFSVMYWSVDPGRSACRGCMVLSGQAGDQARIARLERLMDGVTPVNVGTGPVISLVGGLMAVEAMRHLTGFTPPVAAGRVRVLDLVSGSEQITEWTRHPDCTRCQAARDRDSERAVGSRD